LKNPENLTPNQQAQLEYFVKENSELYRMYLCKERLRLIFKQDSYRNAVLALGRWLLWTRRYGVPEFEKLAEKITRNKKYMLATLKYGLSSGKLEATNNIIGSIIRRSFGFRNVDNLIALIFIRTSEFLDVMDDHFFNYMG
jgi:transposase